jgi:hypothetical protein
MQRQPEVSLRRSFTCPAQHSARGMTRTRNAKRAKTQHHVMVPVHVLQFTIIILFIYFKTQLGPPRALQDFPALPTS